MYKELRPSHVNASSSTPEVWAGMFARSSKIGTYHRIIFRREHRWRLIRKCVPPGGRILDCGCGAGEWVAFLNEMGFIAEGLDYSEALVNRTRAMYPAYQWKNGTIQELPYASESFDAIISWGVIEHDERGPEAALSEFRRVLRPGGVIVVTVPVDNDRQRRYSRSLFGEAGHQDHSWTFFQYFFTADELAQQVKDSGFIVLDHGLQRSPALHMLLPELTARFPLPVVNALNKLVRLLLFGSREIMHMTYCVGAKPPR